MADNENEPVDEDEVIFPAVADLGDDDQDPAVEEAPDEAAADPAPPGYVTIQRDGKSTIVDNRSLAELEAQGWTPAH